MNQKKQLLAASLLATATLSLLAGQPAHAVTFTEPGDAGQTLPTATNTAASVATAGQALTAISGTIGTALDADLYVLSITNTTAFSASTLNGSGLDTSLFLFDSAGRAVVANDDEGSGTTFQSTIPAGTLAGLAPGRYFLGISLSGNEPINLASQFLFTSDAVTTNLRGPATGVNPTTEANFNGGTFFVETGAYTISLAGAATAVPEPSALAALTLGVAATGFAVLRRRQNPA